MKRLSPAQQRLYEAVAEAFPDGEKFSVSWQLEGGGLHITNRRGKSVYTFKVQTSTWHEVARRERGLVEKVDWDNIGTWYIVKGGDVNVDQEA